MRTRGKWTNNGGQIEGPGGYPNVIATVGTVNEQTPTNSANAGLICLAPEMESCLRAVLAMALDTCPSPEQKLENIQAWTQEIIEDIEEVENRAFRAQALLDTQGEARKLAEWKMLGRAERDLARREFVENAEAQP